MLDKKSQILRSAIKLFVEKGFDRVSTAEISKNACVATGTMFYHFNTKEDIIITAYTQIKKEIIALSNASENSELPMKAFLYHTWKSMINWSLVHKTEFQYVLQFKNSPYFRNDIMAEDESYLAKLQWWEEGIKQGVLKPIPLDFLMKSFVDLLYGTTEYLLHNPKNNNENYIDFSFEMCWDAISTN